MKAMHFMFQELGRYAKQMLYWAFYMCFVNIIFKLLCDHPTFSTRNQKLTNYSKISEIIYVINEEASISNQRWPRLTQALIYYFSGLS